MRAGGVQGTSHLTDDAGEGPHRPGLERLWAESWGFDFAAADGSLGGYARLVTYPNLGTAWFWAALAGAGRPLVLVRDQDVPLPRGASTDVRAEGLWSSITCETPYEHWSVGLEAFGVALDDPGDALAGERGDRVALGLDLEWESTSAPFPAPAIPGPAVTGYEQACEVFGDILVGSERMELTGFGQRDHGWGRCDWWSGPWWRVAGRLADGRAFAVRGTGDGASGSGWVAGEEGLSAAIETVLSPAGLPVSASLLIDDLAVPVTPVAHAPLSVSGPEGRSSRLARALCRLAGHTGGPALGWGEWLRPLGCQGVNAASGGGSL